MGKSRVRAVLLSAALTMATVGGGSVATGAPATAPILTAGPTSERSVSSSVLPQLAVPTFTSPFVGRVDLLGRDPAGRLFLYKGTGTGGLEDPTQVGTGWGGMTALIGVGDFSGDGYVDLLARDTAGLLWMYRGNGSGRFISGRTQIGHGWGGMTALIGVGDFSGDGYVDLLARDTAGLLWMYRGNGSGRFISGRTQIGHGWGGMTALIGVGDFSGDGYVDLLARDTAGLLWMYRGNGSGRFISGRTQVSGGWEAMTGLVGVGDFDPPSAPAPVNCAVRACVALTFDDGPSAYTNRLLDSLIAMQVPAAFFVVGQQVQARPSTVLRAHQAGFDIENHTYSHPRLTTLSLSGQQAEVRRVDDALVAAGVPRSTLLRPPYGSWNSSTRQLGKPLILWSVDPRDWDGRTASQIRSHVVANTVAGSIVLMHDTVAATVDAVPGIVSDLRARGFTLVTVETLIPNLQPGDVVYSRTNIVRAGSVAALSEEPELLRAPDGTVLGEVVDEARFVPEK